MTKTEKTLLAMFSSMDESGQSALLEYAEFLAARHPLKQVSMKPLDIERPAQESVVAAIKRLSHTYPMLDRQALLHETSSYMMQHMMHGRDAIEIIDEMEVYFRRQYEQLDLRDQDDTDT